MSYFIKLFKIPEILLPPCTSVIFTMHSHQLSSDLDYLQLSSALCIYFKSPLTVHYLQLISPRCIHFNCPPTYVVSGVSVISTILPLQMSPNLYCSLIFLLFYSCHLHQAFPSCALSTKHSLLLSSRAQRCSPQHTFIPTVLCTLHSPLQSSLAWLL